MISYFFSRSQDAGIDNAKDGQNNKDADGQGKAGPKIQVIEG
jgi:hypothetical protein